MIEIKPKTTQQKYKKIFMIYLFMLTEQQEGIRENNCFS